MGYIVRTVVCGTCGHEMTGRFKPSPPWRCLACGTKHQRETVIAQHEGTYDRLPEMIEAGRSAGDQIRNRKGPAYEKWRAGMLAAARATDDE